MIPTPTSPGALLVSEINQMEQEMCSYLEWQLDIEPGAFIEFEYMLQWDFKGPGPHPAHSLGPLARLKRSTSNMPTAIQSFGPGVQPSAQSYSPRLAPKRLFPDQLSLGHHPTRLREQWHKDRLLHWVKHVGNTR